MAKRCEVHPDLMSSSGIDPEFHKRELAVGRIDSLSDLVMRDGFASSGTAGGHARASHTVAADSGMDSSPFGLHRAMHQRNVRLLDLATGKLGGQFAMHFVVFGDDDQSAGFFIEAMDDSGTQFAADCRKRLEPM